MNWLETDTAGHIANGNGNGDDAKAKALKLPIFVDGKDELDSYLQRFERFAADNNWDKRGWASYLSALLTGQALEVYGCMSDREARDYVLKGALLKRYI